MDTIIAPMFTALEVVMEILIPFVTASIIDKGIQAGNMRAILIYGAITIVMAFLGLYFGIQAGKFSAKASSGFAAGLRDGMYTKIQTFAFSNIDK